MLPKTLLFSKKCQIFLKDGESAVESGSISSTTYSAKIHKDNPNVTKETNKYIYKKKKE